MHRRGRYQRRSTPAGEHRPVMLRQLLELLRPAEGETAVDCTCGFAGHSREILKAVGPTGKLFAFDLDPANIPKARERLEAVGNPFVLTHGNFAGFPKVLGEHDLLGCDVLLADLGMSSMQVDEASRGFSYMRDGPLDMRMDNSRGRTAAELLQQMKPDELAEALAELGDEPEAYKIAGAIAGRSFTGTVELMEAIQAAAPVKVMQDPKFGTPWQQKNRPVTRVFQALRILVNRELANLAELLRVLPYSLNPGGRAAIISFHSGEDRLVKKAFEDGHRKGLYAAISDDPMRPDYSERTTNPRSRSAKVRWCVRAA